MALIFIETILMSHGNRVSEAYGYRMDDQDSVLGGAGTFFFATKSTWLWGSPSRVSNGYWMLFPQR